MRFFKFMSVGENSMGEESDSLVIENEILKKCRHKNMIQIIWRSFHMK